jgi:hypothetical protein
VREHSVDSDEPAVELQQLDLFVDGRDALLVHAVVTSVLARDPEAAAVRLALLRREHPAHPDLPALALMTDALRSSPPLPASHATLTVALENIDRMLLPAAQRLLGRDTAAFLGPLWQTLAAAAARMPFDERYPRAHASWLCQQFGDWAAVRAAVEAEPDWATRPLLRYRLGLALHHLDDPDAAVTLWLPLCWIDPELFARYASTLPNATVREGWEAFERAGPFGESLDATHVAEWFPAWLLVRHRRLADLFEAANVPEMGTSTEAFRALLSLVPLERQGLSDELIVHRRALQRLSPELFAYYMESLGGRRPSRQPLAE